MPFSFNFSLRFLESKIYTREELRIPTFDIDTTPNPFTGSRFKYYDLLQKICLGDSATINEMVGA